MGDLGLFDDFLRQMRWDKDDPFAISENHIARHDESIADMHGYVDSQNADAGDRGRMRCAEVDLGRQLGEPVQIADRAVDNCAGVGRRPDCGLEIIAAEVVTGRGSHQVDDRHVVQLELVDYALVHAVRHAFGLGVGVDHFGEVRPHGHVLRGEGASH